MQQANGHEKVPPVAIVGAGPVGLVAALYLSRLKVPFVVLEEDAGLSTAAKAGTLTPRSLEIFSQLGVVDDVLAEGLRLDVVDFVERRQDRVLMRMPLYELHGETAFPFTINLPQSEYERILEAHASRSPFGEVRFEHRVVDLDQEEEGCRLTVETPNGTETIDASYVLACDGGRSAVRRMLGIKHEGKTYPEKFALIDIETNLDEGGRRPAYLSYIFDPEEWLILVRQPRMWRVLWPIPPDAPEPEDAEVERKLRLAVGDRPLRVLGSLTYKVHHRVAQRWRAGRVFLLGDAAHLITPVGGLGASTGIMDANNLSWKVAWVLRGLASPVLLDTYEQERRPIAEFIAGGLADRNRSMMRMKNPLKRAARDAALLTMQRFRAHRWNIAYVRSLLATGYHGDSREHSRLSGIVRRTFRSILPRTDPQVLAGDRAPDGMLFGPDGRRRWLHELLGVSFAAFTFDDARNGPEITPLQQQPSFLRHYLVSPSDAPHDTMLRDRTFWDVGGSLTRRFHAVPGTTFLLRPDGHVAAVEPPNGRTAQRLYEEYVGSSHPEEHVSGEEALTSGTYSGVR
ncbi:MAG: FAD-dependent monooxygenase [Rubrobacteraceae bacterium]